MSIAECLNENINETPMQILFRRVDDTDTVESIPVEDCILIVDLFRRIRDSPQLGISKTFGVIRRCYQETKSRAYWMF
jgi:hypothetical protein